MKPLYIYALVLLLSVTGLAAIGVVLTRLRMVRSRHMAAYTRLCTLLVLAAAYGMDQNGWPGVHLRQVDLLSLLVILAILVYSLIHAALALALPQEQEDFKKSYMLSMLYTDSQQMTDADLQGPEKKSAKP